MNTNSFNPESLFASNVAAGAARWSGAPKYNFVGGHNDPESVPGQALMNAATRVLEDHAGLLATYNLGGSPQGYLPLREFVKAKLNDHRGMACDVDDILITSGSLQGLDLVNDLFVDKGDTVLVEEHTYGGALTRLKKKGANIIGVPLDNEGLKIDALEAIVQNLAAKHVKPKFLYTIPTVQNPTSAIMSRQRRADVIALAQRYDLLIFEDECYADLVWGDMPPPSLHAMDDSHRVIHIGSFSKSIAPALRVGYLVADWPIMSRILANKTDAGSGALEQMVLAEFCRWHFDEHLAVLNRRLQVKSEGLCRAIRNHFGEFARFEQPAGGIFQWITFPERIDTLALAPAALAAGVAYNPGPEWSTNDTGSAHSLRLCFANPNADIANEGVAVLADVFKQHL